jgi:low temperature requirement protein LtrA
VLLALAEMLVPAWAEHGRRGTSWHPQHISERYGLFTLIVLGECVEEGLRVSRSSAFLWGYAHYAVCGSIAALGAGLEVAVESTRRGSGVSPMTAGGAVAISVAVYLVATGAVQVRLNPSGVLKTRFIVPFAALIVLVGLSARSLSIGVTLPLLGLVVVGVVLLDRLVPRLHRAGPAADDDSLPSVLA